MSASSHSLRVGSRLGETYAVARYLGVGAFCESYEVRDDQDRRLVAKVMPSGSGAVGQQAVLALSAEVQRLSSLDEPRILPVLDVGDDSTLDLHYVITPLLDGFALEELVERVGPLHPMAAVRLVMQASDAMRLAHQKGMVHKDIQPSSLFLEHSVSRTVSVRICDFGLLSWVRQQRALAATGTMSPFRSEAFVYRAPELWVTGGEASPSVDVWGLAMTLYYALCGCPSRAAASDVRGADGTGALAHMQDIAPWIPPGLAQVVHGALINEPGSRCPSVEAWMEALEPFAGGTWEMASTSLVAVPREVSRLVTPRCELPACWDHVVGTGEGSLPSVDEDPLAGKVVADYRLERLIGRGGMGAVYQARDKHGHHCAVKVLQEGAASRPGSLQRLVREARSMMKISSPYVAKLIDAGVDRGVSRPYLVMELLKGTDLERHMLRAGPLDPGPIVRLFVQLCEGLGAAHAAHVIHRDIKPSNIFISAMPDGEIVPKLFDFGVAKQIEGDAVSALTRTGHIMGSPRYMSPEQAQDAKNIDARSDIWSLGVSLYEAIGGINPWAAYDTLGELLLAICTRTPEPLVDTAPWVEPGLAVVVHRCLERNPDNRYQTAQDLAVALAPYASKDKLDESMLGGVSIARLATSTGDLSTDASPPKKARRPRRFAMLAAGVVFVLCAAGAVAWLRTSGSPEMPLATNSFFVAPSLSSALPSALPSELASASAAASIVLQIKAVPTTAQLFLDGQPLPSNPYETRWLADGQRRVVRAEAPGFRPAEKSFEPSVDVTLVLELEPNAARIRKPGVSTAKAPPPKKPDCNPPFYLDERGVKKFKPGCI